MKITEQEVNKDNKTTKLRNKVKNNKELEENAIL